MAIRLIDAQAIASDGERVLALQTGSGLGTPALLGNDPPYTWAWFGPNCPSISAVELSEIFADVSRLSRFPESSALIVRDEVTGRVIAATDRLGTQAVYYTSGALPFVSTHLMWLLCATGHDGSYDMGGFADHIGFGHAIDADRQIYKGVLRVPPGCVADISASGTRIVRYWPEPELFRQQDLDLDAAGDALRLACRAPARFPVFGLTSGKDSLCIAAASDPAMGFTYGLPDCDDRSQGAAVAANLGWPHRHAGLCPPERLRRWVDWIALHSAGLTTAAYADMLDAVESCVPPGGAYAMGCGAGSINNNWPCAYTHDGAQTALEAIRDRFITPHALLSEALPPEACPRHDYAEELLDRAGVHQGHPAHAIKHFYRRKRMSGNFGQRHSIIAPLRAKISPLCDPVFMDHTYSLDSKWYARASVHRAIISRRNPELLRFLDQPRRGGPPIQDFRRRLAGGFGQAIRDLIEECLPFSPVRWNRRGIDGLMAANHPLADRAPYFLLRVVSLLAAARILKRGEMHSYETMSRITSP